MPDSVMWLINKHSCGCPAYLFTTPIIYKSLVIITQEHNHHITNRDDIANKTIALVKGYQYADSVGEEFPNIIPVYVDTMREAFELVAAGQADATISFLAAANYFQLKYAYNDLKIAAFYEKHNANEAIAVSKTAPILASIIQKGIDSLTSQQKKALNEVWGANIKIPKDYTELIEFALLSGLLMLLLSIWGLQAKRHNRDLVKANQNAEAANSALNDLKDNLQQLVAERTQQLTQSENRYRGLVESLEDEYIFYQHDTRGYVSYVSPSLTHILGHPVSGKGGFYHQFLTDSPKNQKVAKYVERILQGENLAPFEIELDDTKGNVHTFEVLERPMYDDNNECIGCEGIAHDVTARKQQQDKLFYLSHYDDLTGLVNRYYFKKLLDDDIDNCKKMGQPLALLFLDLTRFKVINDNFGHSAGDYILNQAAARIQAHLNNDFIVSRFAGDKFCISLPNTRAADANLMAIELIEAFQPHFEFLEQTIIIGCRVGISLFPQDGLNADTLISHADSALYEAKKNPACVAFCNKEMASYNKKRHVIEQNLSKALFVNDNSLPPQLFTVYQPLMSLPECQLAGFEALVRWEHPELGVISPGEFIPIAEDTGLIFTLSHWVVNSVCEQLVEWHQQGFDFKRVSVNISALELMNIKFAEELLSMVVQSGAQPSWFKLEITETALMAIPEQAIEILQKLTRADFEVAIDDFGTGYSSLTYLKSLPASTLKIDQSFIRNLIESSEDQAVIKAVISMAHSLGKQVTAEGVEQQEQLDYLIAHGCDVAQGYYFSRPISVQEVNRLYFEV
ncbi:hypothetical protein GCM10009347_34170 [Shewanella algicola]|uniref:EAL domain-containing protein n=1 Tax=Shewanella algicola TaxID=640633 RepID=A0A9X1Z8A0_9GAMM|nr:EAL domain-containing protein [Shewanella algicola]MCL1107134.1 EAL domain-containing protein [Shewanella algicola]GGP65579.1 hypothetical protein GCM10009347_34170 [Shewanella algicola]